MINQLPHSLPSASAPWLPDQGDGTYRNPVLFADYSDPDAIRVGEDFWLTSSSFNHTPGLPILHSHDLVNWTFVNHALPRLVPDEHFSTPRHGAGVWAPSIRFHEGKFWIFYPDPDFGLYAITADDPRKPWSEPVLVKAGKGLIDPCPFWDKDGTGYLIHGWAKSRAGIKNRLTLHKLHRDNLGVADAGEVIIDGDKMQGWETIEGPKLYSRDGYYYVFAPAGGVTSGYQAVFRSRDIYGPYENKIVLAQGATSVNGPHQGAWVDTPQGSDWFLHFQELPAYGRVVHLQPMQWRDGWPAMGTLNPNGTGQPVLVAPIPVADRAQATAPESSDEFESTSLALQWQWQANPKPEWLSLSARPSWLRLNPVAREPNETLWSASHLLMQKFPAPEFEATTSLDFAPRSDGEIAGLVLFGYSYAWLGLQRESGRLRVVLARCDDANEGHAERLVATQPVEGGKIFLRVTVNAHAQCQFAFANDGKKFTLIGDLFQARSSRWVGAKVGVFTEIRGKNGAPRGHADFDWFRIAAL